MELDYDNRKIILTIGAPASGKSTWAHSFYEPHEVISSDEIRKMITGDATDQSVTPQAWMVAHALIKAKLQSFQSRTIVDATNVKRKDRKNLINFIRTWMPHGTSIVGLVFAPTKDTLILRDTLRGTMGGYSVGSAVIERMLQALKSSPPSLEDGFDVLIVHDNDMGLKLNYESFNNESSNNASSREQEYV